MKTELKVCAHHVTPGVLVVELWHAGELIGTVVGTDGPGVRVVTRHAILTDASKTSLTNRVEVQILVP